MADPKELTRLIQQLQRVSSPLQRAKMLSRAWRSLRRLSPQQRQVLADQVGIADGADLIEKLAVRKGGLNPSVVQRALESVGDTNVGDLRKVLQGLRDPERRKGLVRRGFEMAADSLAGPETVEEPVAEPEPTAERAPKVAAATTVGVTAAAAVAAKAASNDKNEVVSRRDEPKSSAPPPPRPAAPVVAPTKPATVKPAPAVAVTEKPAPPPPVPVVAKSKPAPPPLPDEERPASSNVGSSLLDRVGAETMLSRRFRIFREHLDEARGMNARQLRDLLDLFPSSWGQRRVLNMLFERGIPGSVNKAVFLIEHLDSMLARRWCVKTLLGSWTLSAAEREALVDRHAVFRVAADTR